MNVFILLVATIITAVLSLVGGYLLVLGKGKNVKKVQQFGPIIAFIMLIYAVFFDIIPEILEEEELSVLTLIALSATGFAVCAIVGALVGKFHHHSDIHKHHHEKEIEDYENEGIKNKTQAYTMLAVDSIHAVADGIVMGTSFLASPATGISTCLATVAHEIPQEVGDFSIMQRAKLKPIEIVKLQTISSLIVVPAALVAYYVGDALLESLPVVLAVVSGFLLYVALGELICVIETLKTWTKK